MKMEIVVEFVTAVILYCAGILVMISPRNELQWLFWLTVLIGVSFSIGGIGLFIGVNATRKMNAE